eukprot:TRINITY_DN260_c0_g1_i1.p1 TRINITY_DN260_c0_g1~~TRINITY_DN260_c0_g1_i1.p1  ORF type:complete len:206 (+),score=56.21 TRINITY_DN260_c0_g1_i1:75-692(+)
MSAKEETQEVDAKDENDVEYKVSKKVGINDLLNLDKEDESLRKYKESLLGQATKEAYAPKDDPRRVVILELKVTCQGRPGGDIVYKLETPAAISKLKETPFILKEECQYRIQLTFRVQHEIVSGLKYVNTVTRAGIKVDKSDTMIGSFAPQFDPYTSTFPRNGWEEAPKGMVARGKYKAKSQFIDDDKQVHLEFEYHFEIKKDWE